MPQKKETNPLAAGDPRVFDRLYADFAPRVLGYLLPLTGGNRPEAEDLVQETFVAAYAARATYQGRSQPLAWLLGIARRRWRDGRRTPRLEAAPFAEGDTEPRIDGHADRVTREAALRMALDRLGPEEREALLLTAVQGLTYREAAEVLGEPVGTVKWRVSMATRRLRVLLDDQKDDDETRNDARPIAAADRIACGR